MANHYNHQIVEITRKTTCKSPCKSPVKPVCIFTPLHPLCVNLHLPTDFFFSFHPLSHTPSTPDSQLFFPLFHRAYYYYYELFI